MTLELPVLAVTGNLGGAPAPSLPGNDYAAVVSWDPLLPLLECTADSRFTGVSKTPESPPVPARAGLRLLLRPGSAPPHRVKPTGLYTALNY